MLAAAFGCVFLLFAVACVAGGDAPAAQLSPRGSLGAGDAASKAREGAARDEALKSTTACHGAQQLNFRVGGQESQRLDTRFDALALQLAQLTRERAQRFSNVVSSGSPLRSWLVLPLRAQGPPARS